MSEDNTVFDFYTNPRFSLSSPSSNIDGHYTQFASTDYGEDVSSNYGIMSSSFHYLPPIEENSEPSSSNSSDSSTKSNHFSFILLKASSFHDIASNIDEWDESAFSDSSQGRSQTFPKRSKSTSRNTAAGLRENRTLFPLEPRELDPESFHQLHDADSQEELQEFLLLESQCMSNEEGISAAFVQSSK